MHGAYRNDGIYPTSEYANVGFRVSEILEPAGCPCIYDLDGSCFVDAADLGLFAGCWLCEEGQPCWADNDCVLKDWDDSGVIDAADLGLFAGAWLKGCDELDPTEYVGSWYCEGDIICPWREARPEHRMPTSGGDAAARREVAALTAERQRILAEDKRPHLGSR
jgi:hypothetical protein